MRQGVLQSMKILYLGGGDLEFRWYFFSINANQERNSRVEKCGQQLAG